jgi:hypothetical protein
VNLLNHLVRKRPSESPAAAAPVAKAPAVEEARDDGVKKAREEQSKSATHK